MHEADAMMSILSRKDLILSEETFEFLGTDGLKETRLIDLKVRNIFIETVSEA